MERLTYTALPLQYDRGAGDRSLSNGYRVSAAEGSYNVGYTRIEKSKGLTMHAAEKKKKKKEGHPDSHCVRLSGIRKEKEGVEAFRRIR